MATVEEVRGTSFATVAGKAPSKQRGANHPPVDVRLDQNTSVWVRRTLRRAAGRPSAYTYWLKRLVAELSKIAEDYGAKYRKSRNDLAAERKLVRELRGKINETLPPGELAPSQAELDAAERRVQDLKNVAAKTRHMPGEYIKGTNDVSPAFLDYLRPLVGKMPLCGVL